MKVCVAGATGAIATRHLDAIDQIDGVEVVSVMDVTGDRLTGLAKARGIGHATADLDECLARPEIDAVILGTPTQMHAAQAIKCLRAGKHVLVEIPMADTLADSKRLVEVQKETGLVAMAGHVRRFNPSHQWIHNRIRKRELAIQHLQVQTYFFRRKNLNALGQPRSWTDHLLWHHACHTVDLFQYQTGAAAKEVFALQGPLHPELGIAMDMSIGLKAPSGALCTLTLSFNNDGPLGTDFRYICDNGTYLARYDDLTDGHDKPVDLSGVADTMNGFVLEDREFFSAIDEGREPNSSVAQALSAMETLDRLERCLRE